MGREIIVKGIESMCVLEGYAKDYYYVRFHTHSYDMCIDYLQRKNYEVKWAVKYRSVA